MRKVMNEWHVAKYAILTLDGSVKEEPAHSKYRILGIEYVPVPVYDMGDNVIAIESSDSLLGKNVEFI